MIATSIGSENNTSLFSYFFLYICSDGLGDVLRIRLIKSIESNPINLHSFGLSFIGFDNVLFS